MENKAVAKGTFEVEITPESERQSGDITFGTYGITKKFQGSLEATSSFAMYTAGTNNGAGVYVAIEQVNGRLDGKTGTFLLVHTGTRTKNSQHVTVSVAPECSTGELVGLEGTMSITIVDGKHWYEFEYAFTS